MPTDALDRLAVQFDDRGLVPAVAVDYESGAVLMVAWMNAEALAQTIQSGQATFWSRSRRCLWRKGETSGNTLTVREVRLDCDEDTVLVVVEPHGPACHTGATSCFFRRVAPERTDDRGFPGSPASVVDRIFHVLQERKRQPDPSGSYTATLFRRGWIAISAKLNEEAAELVAELPAGADEAVVHEAADLLFHLAVALVERGIPASALWQELERRFGVSGLAEKAARFAPP